MIKSDISQRIFYWALIVLLSGCSGEQDDQRYRNWSSYLGDKTSSQYSSLDQINLENVQNLQVAWTYRSGDADSKNRTQIQCNPIIINGVLYGSTPALKFFALSAATGVEIWKFDPFSGDYDMFGMGVNRGLVYWSEGKDQRILCTAGRYVDRTCLLVQAKTTPAVSSSDSLVSILWPGLVSKFTGIGNCLENPSYIPSPHIEGPDITRSGRQ